MVPGIWKTRAWSVGLLFLAAAILILLGKFIMLPKEPIQDGKPLSEWIKLLTSAQSKEEQKQAQEEIIKIGTNAVPELLRILAKPDRPLHTAKVISWLGQKNLAKIISWLGEKNSERFGLSERNWQRNSAAEAFKLLGSKADYAVPSLVELLDKPYSGIFAVRSLGHCGPSADRPLLQALAHSNSGVRYQAALELGWRKCSLEGTVNGLTNALTDTNVTVRIGAAYALRYFPERGNVIVPALIPLLDKPHSEEREMAINSLGRFREAARVAVPKLLKIYNENRSNEAIHAIHLISPSLAAELTEASKQVKMPSASLLNSSN